MHEDDSDNTPVPDDALLCLYCLSLNCIVPPSRDQLADQMSQNPEYSPDGTTAVVGAAEELFCFSFCLLPPSVL